MKDQAQCLAHSRNLIKVGFLPSNFKRIFSNYNIWAPISITSDKVTENTLPRKIHRTSTQHTSLGNIKNTVLNQRFPSWLHSESLGALTAPWGQRLWWDPSGTQPGTWSGPVWVEVPPTFLPLSLGYAFICLHLAFVPLPFSNYVLFNKCSKQLTR